MNTPAKIAVENQVKCQFCSWPNAISLKALERVQVRCARCKLQLSTQKHQKFRHLDPAVYMHPEDIEALKHLKQMPGAESVVQKISPLAGQMFGEAFFAANGLRISEDQYPDLYAKLQAACETLGMHTRPNLYLSFVDVFGDLGMSTYSGGTSAHPFVVLSPVLLEELDELDVLSALSHELGHIHCGHLEYKVAADYLCMVIHRAFKKNPLEKIANSISLPIQQSLMTWRVKSNFSADRSALLIVQKEKAIFSLLMKLSGGNLSSRASLDAFVKQAAQLNQSMIENWVENYWQQFLYTHRVFDFPVWRATELLGWTRENQKTGYGFKDIVNIFAA